MPTEPVKPWKRQESCPECDGDGCNACASPAEPQPAGETPQAEDELLGTCDLDACGHDGRHAQDNRCVNWQEWIDPLAREKIMAKMGRLREAGLRAAFVAATAQPAGEMPQTEPLCRCPDKVCLLHPNSPDFYTECSFRNRTLAPVAATAPVPPNEKPKCTCPTIGNCVYVGAGSNCPVHNRVDAPVPPQAGDAAATDIAPCEHPRFTRGMDQMGRSATVEWIMCESCNKMFFEKTSFGADTRLVIDICRETYDKFVMGGWEPQDAHQMVAVLILEAQAEMQGAPDEEPLAAQAGDDAERVARAIIRYLDRYRPLLNAELEAKATALIRTAMAGYTKIINEACLCEFCAAKFEVLSGEKYRAKQLAEAKEQLVAFQQLLIRAETAESENAKLREGLKHALDLILSVNKPGWSRWREVVSEAERLLIGKE